MNNTEFQIFEPSIVKKPTNKNMIVFLIYLFAVIFFWTTDKYFSSSDFFRYFKNSYLFFGVSLSIYWLISGLLTYESLNGKFNGYLVFADDAFQINDELIRLKDIKSLNIFGEDYYGQQTRGVKLDFNPSLSQGVNNYFEFTDLENLTRKIYFKQHEKNSHRQLKSFIACGAKLNKISLIRATELLGITDYDEIKEFKKNYH